MKVTMSSPRSRYAASPAKRWARWGGSNVPPRMPRRTPRRIGTRPVDRRHRNQAQTRVRGIEATEPPRRIVVAVPHTNREMQCLQTMIHAGRPYHRQPIDMFSRNDGHAVEVRIGRAQSAAVSDCDCKHPGNTSGKRHVTSIGRTHRGALSGSDVDPPMTAVAPDGRKGAQSRPGHRHGKTCTGGERGQGRCGNG